MSTARKQPDTPTTSNIPQFTMGDRLRRARRDAGMEAQDIAATLGISRNTVSNAENDRGPVARRTLVGWAWATGVPLEWLERGTGPDHSTDPGDGPQPDTSPPPSPRTPAGVAARRRTVRGPNSSWSQAPAARVRVSTQRRSPALGVYPLGAGCRSAA